MLAKGLSFFRLTKTTQMRSAPPGWFKTQLDKYDFNKKFPKKITETSKPSVKVFYNSHYLRPDEIPLALTKIPAINVSGDKAGFFQNGLSFPSDSSYFARIPADHPELLSPEQRLLSGKKIIYSDSHVIASGGYPYFNPVLPYEKPFSVGVFSLAGASFENDYLHYTLFALDPMHQQIVPKGRFTHLFDKSPTTFVEAKRELGIYDLNEKITRFRIGFPYLARTKAGRFYPSFSKANTIIFLSHAYFQHLLEDTALLLSSVNDRAEAEGKPALLKATAVGMGFFAKINGAYDIKYLLYPYLLRAFKQLISEHSYPWIAKIEFPIFDEFQEEQFDTIFQSPTSPIEVYQTQRDVLQFKPDEIERYYPCVINPSDSFAYSGNEWGYGSVEAMIGNNTSLRFDQVYHTNPLILDSSCHIPVTIEKDYKTILSKPETEGIKPTL